MTLPYTVIRNADVSPLTLCAPFRGILGPGEVAIVPRDINYVRTQFSLAGVGGTIQFKEIDSAAANGTSLRFMLPMGAADLDAEVVTTIVDNVVGDDATAVGSAEQPFATLAAALARLNSISFNGTQRILLQGDEEHILPDAYTIPPFVGTVQNYTSYTGPYGFNDNRSIIIEAEPITVLAITALQWSANSASAAVRVINYIPGGLVVDALKGLWFVDATNLPFLVTSNTADTITFCAVGAPTGALTVYRHGATLRTAAPVVGSAVISFVGSTATIAINGIKILGDGGLGQPAVSLSNSVEFAACWLEGGAYVSAYGPTPYPTLSMGSSYLSTFVYNIGGYFAFIDGLLDGVDLTVYDPRCVLSIRGVLEACTGVGSSQMGNSVGPGPLYCSIFGDINNAAGDAIDFVGPGQLTFSGRVQTAGGNGIKVNGGRADISAEGSAITDIGVVLVNGAQAKLNASTISGGGGGVKVGSLAPIATVGLVNTFDTIGADADLSRAYP